MQRLVFVSFLVLALGACQKEISDFGNEAENCRTKRIFFDVVSNEQGQVENFSDTFELSYTGKMLSRMRAADIDFVIQYQDSLITRISAFDDYRDPSTQLGYYEVVYSPGGSIAGIDFWEREASSFSRYNSFTSQINPIDSLPVKGRGAYFDQSGNVDLFLTDSFYYTFSDRNLTRIFEPGSSPAGVIRPEETTLLSYSSNPNRLLKTNPEMLAFFIVDEYHLWHSLLSAFVFSRNELVGWKNNLEDIDVNYTYNPQTGRLSTLVLTGELDQQFYTTTMTFRFESNCP